MAEGFLKHYARAENKNVEIYSAGVETHGVNPLAIKVMLEKQIDYPIIHLIWLMLI